MKVKVYVKLKSGVLDPQGTAIQKSLLSLGYDKIAGVKQGKMFEVDVKAASKEEAESLVAEAAGKLLANPVIEDFTVEAV